MTSMKVYDIQVFYNDKTVVIDGKGPYYGSYLEGDKSMSHRIKELNEDPNVFITLIKTSWEMA